MAKPKKLDKTESVQFGWRLDAKDIPILDELRNFADLHRLSRNAAVTLAVEKLLDSWKANGKAKMM